MDAPIPNTSAQLTALANALVMEPSQALPVTMERIPRPQYPIPPPLCTEPIQRIPKPRSPLLSPIQPVTSNRIPRPQSPILATVGPGPWTLKFASAAQEIFVPWNNTHREPTCRFNDIENSSEDLDLDRVDLWSIWNSGKGKESKLKGTKKVTGKGKGNDQQKMDVDSEEDTVESDANDIVQLQAHHVKGKGKGKGKELADLKKGKKSKSTKRDKMVVDENETDSGSENDTRQGSKSERKKMGKKISSKKEKERQQQQLDQDSGNSGLDSDSDSDTDTKLQGRTMMDHKPSQKERGKEWMKAEMIKMKHEAYLDANISDISISHPCPRKSTPAMGKQPSPRSPIGTGQLHDDPCTKCMHLGRDCEIQEASGTCVNCRRYKHKCEHVQLRLGKVSFSWKVKMTPLHLPPVNIHTRLQT